MSYCGIDLADNGTIISKFSDVCNEMFPYFQALGIKTEIATGTGNCSIDAMRKLWLDTTISPIILLDALILANASGLNIDFEPQSDDCQGSASGNRHDAILFAKW